MSEHDTAATIELLDLDAVVLDSYLTDVLTWLERADIRPQRILDLGAGTGSGALALAQQFTSAEVVAVDASEPQLDRILAKARELGLADRIRTVRLDLDHDWPQVDGVDLTWASMSLHHLGDPDAVLARVLATTRPGGFIAVAEFSDPVRLLPDDLALGRPGFEQRCLDAMHAAHADELPDLGADWTQRLAAAGFTVVDQRTFDIHLDPPHPPTTGRYARLWFERLQAGLGERLDDDDRATLAVLVGDGPQSVTHREDLYVHGSRTVTLARRPLTQ